jgi:hypothetical protein
MGDGSGLARGARRRLAARRHDLLVAIVTLPAAAWRSNPAN